MGGLQVVQPSASPPSDSDPQPVFFATRIERLDNLLPSPCDDSVSKRRTLFLCDVPDRLVFKVFFFERLVLVKQGACLFWIPADGTVPGSFLAPVLFFT